MVALLGGPAPARCGSCLRRGLGSTGWSRRRRTRRSARSRCPWATAGTAPSDWSPRPAPRGTCRTGRWSSRSASASRRAGHRCWGGSRCSPAHRCASSVMSPIPTVWWFRPVSSACRVGAHIAVRVEPVVPQAAGRQPFGGRGVDRPAEGGRGAETHVVEQDDEHIRRALGRAQRLDGRERRVRVLGIVGGEPERWGIGDWENHPLETFADTHVVPPWPWSRRHGEIRAGGDDGAMPIRPPPPTRYPATRVAARRPGECTRMTTILLRHARARGFTGERVEREQMQEQESDVAEGPQKRDRRSREEVSEALIDAAAALASERGSGHVTVRDIAARAGVNATFVAPLLRLEAEPHAGGDDASPGAPGLADR